MQSKIPAQPGELPSARDEGEDHARELPSGLSALIQAATSQLSAVSEETSGLRYPTRRVLTLSHSDDTSGDESKELTPAPNRTPLMIPEPDPRKQSFPELLMTLALDPNNSNVIAFLPDGKFFAVRADEFADNLMAQCFAVATFDEFLDLAKDWGFTRVLKDTNISGIEVFRHPLFVKDKWEECSRIKFGESPTDAMISALPDGVRIEISLTADSSTNQSTAHSKRRLSPGFLSRRASETSVTSQKQKTGSDSDNHPPPKLERRHSDCESEAAESLHALSFTHVSRTDDLRSIALSITTEKLKINRDREVESQEPLVERALTSATETIVTDAIESLLRDKSHSEKTYLKHEKELSRSSLPGVVPISSQLFSTNENGEAHDV